MEIGSTYDTTLLRTASTLFVRAINMDSPTRSTGRLAPFLRVLSWACGLVFIRSRPHRHWLPCCHATLVASSSTAGLSAASAEIYPLLDSPGRGRRNSSGGGGRDGRPANARLLAESGLTAPILFSSRASLLRNPLRSRLLLLRHARPHTRRPGPRSVALLSTSTSPKWTPLPPPGWPTDGGEGLS